MSLQIWPRVENNFGLEDEIVFTPLLVKRLDPLPSPFFTQPYFPVGWLWKKLENKH
jgi:hypothetical protein